MKIKKFIVALASVGLLMAGLTAVNLGEKHSAEEARADVVCNSTYSSIYNDSWNNTSFAEGYNNVLICYNGEAHGLTGDPIRTQDVLEKITITGTSVWGVIPWDGQTWFRIIYPNSVSEGAVLKVEGGLTIGNAVFRSFSLELQSNSKWSFAPTDYGTFVFDGANNDSTVANFYGINWTANDLPVGWDTEAFVPADENSGTFIGNTRVGNEIKKLGPNTYYVAVDGATVGSVVTIKGNWKNSIGKFTVQPITRQWNGERWVLPDYGTFTFSRTGSGGTINNLYVINETANDLPAGWDSERFEPVDANSGAFIGGVRVGTEIKKLDSSTYYVSITGASLFSIVTVKGTWSNSIATFSVQQFVCEWNGYNWVSPLTDLGTFNFDSANGDSTINNLYAINWITNDQPAGWDSEKFQPADSNSGTFINGSRVGAEIKKLGPNTYYVAVTGATVGSVVTIKGTWVNSSAKFTIADFSAQWNGTSWRTVDPSFTAADFAKLLLKRTLEICSAASDGNHDELENLWSSLAGNDKFGLLVSAQQNALRDASADGSIVVPTTSSGIDNMSDENAVASAMYRYDYCTAKYGLTNFIGRTLSISFGSNALLKLFTNQSNNTIFVIILISIVSVSAIGFYFFRTKRD